MGAFSLRSFEEWRAFYEREAEPCTVEPDELLYFEPEHGFFYYRVLRAEGVLYVDHFATDDYQYLYRRARALARAEGCHAVGTVTFHPAKAYARLSRAHLDLKRSGPGANGRWYWAFEEELNDVEETRI